MIRVDGLTRKFDDFTAVDNMSFTVSCGEILGFLGPNGAGKSTTMRMITGFLSPNSGNVSLNGQDIQTSPLLAKQHVGYLPEGAPLYADMTVLELLNFLADIHQLKGKLKIERLDLVIEEMHLSAVLHQSVDTLSKGFKRRVGLAQAILHDPKILILDEPTDGLDPNQKHEVRSLIKKIASEKAIIISTHLLEEVTSLCTRVAIINAGKLIEDCQPEALLRQSRYHHAVTLTLTKPLDIKSELLRIPQVKEVERDATGQIYTLFPNNGQIIFPEVNQMIQSHALPVEEFNVMQGTLDDVFRRLTQKECA